MKKLSIALVALVTAGSLVSVAGCKKKSEPAPASMSGSSDKPAEPAGSAAAAPTTPPAAPATPPAGGSAEPAAGSAGSGSN